MDIILILAGPYTSCLSTSDIWQQVCNNHQITLEVTNLNDDRAKEIINNLKIRSFPALIYHKKIVAVGHPDLPAAEEIIAGLKKTAVKTTSLHA